MVSDLDLLNSSEGNLVWFQENFAKLQEEFGGKIIAIKDRKVIASAKNGKELLEVLEKKNIDDSEVIIENIYPRGEITIL